MNIHLYLNRLDMCAELQLQMQFIFTYMYILRIRRVGHFN